MQLGSNNRNKPSDADLKTIELKEGDLIVIGTDGLFDNLYDNDIIATISQYNNKNNKSFKELITSVNLAEQIALKAFKMSSNKTYFSPFAQGQQYNKIK